MTTLTDRYVHATVRSVPEARRDEIARELRASIHDMVGDRLENGEDHVTAERAVLTELGNPDRLAIQYTDRPNHLIGPRFFVTYQRLVLRLLLWIPVPIGVLAGVVDLVDSGSASAIGEGIGAAVLVALHIAFWTTLTFAILERVDVDPGLPGWSVDNLPELPTGRDVSVADTCASVVMVVVMAAVLVGQHFRSWVEDGDGGNVPVLDPGAWQPWLLIVLGSLVLELFIQLAVLRDGRWTMATATANLVGGLLFAVPVVYLAAGEELLNAEFFSQIGANERSFDLTHLGVLIGVVLTIAWDVGAGYVKAWRSERLTSAPSSEPQAVR